MNEMKSNFMSKEVIEGSRSFLCEKCQGRMI